MASSRPYLSWAARSEVVGALGLIHPQAGVFFFFF